MNRGAENTPVSFVIVGTASLIVKRLDMAVVWAVGDYHGAPGAFRHGLGTQLPYGQVVTAYRCCGVCLCAALGGLYSLRMVDASSHFL